LPAIKVVGGHRLSWNTSNRTMQAVRGVSMAQPELRGKNEIP
jgi:hypothetical protein